MMEERERVRRRDVFGRRWKRSGRTSLKKLGRRGFKLSEPVADSLRAGRRMATTGEDGQG